MVALLANILMNVDTVKEILFQAFAWLVLELLWDVCASTARGIGGGTS